MAAPFLIGATAGYVAANTLVPANPPAGAANSNYYSKETLDKVSKRPDYQDPAFAKECPVCSKKLSLLNRRHCERDGRVYCKACTKAQADLSALGFDHPAHVCQACFLEEEECAKQDDMQTHIDADLGQLKKEDEIK